jgi:23S rRNA U2552 (ribose-2'-O)-methylase RlmE/FtsJ
MATKDKNNLSRERIGFYSPISSVMVKNQKNILDTTGDINTSSNVDYPKFAFGFHHFIHSDKNKMQVLEKFNGKKKVYRVMNEFEIYIDDYDEGIGNKAAKIFSPRPDIITRSFYKLWEIFFYFDIVNKKSKDFSSIHISDSPNSFVQSMMYYRDMYCENKNDSYYALESNNDVVLQKNFQNKYAKNVKYFKGVDELCTGVKGRVDLITGDRGMVWTTKNTQEQECFDIIFEQILCAVKKQKQGGHFVCKFFETFTLTSVKYIAILTQLYENVYFVKPLTSRGSNSEKYAVCMNFKANEKDAQTIGTKLEKIYSQIKGLGKNKFLVDIFPDFEIENDFKMSVVNINKTVANEQLKSINRMIEYIEGTNYHGDVYVENRNRQIKAAEFWCDLFLAKDLENNVTKARDIINKDNMGLQDEYTRLLKIVNVDSATTSPAQQGRLSGKNKSKNVGKNKNVSKSKSKSKGKDESKSKSKSKGKDESKSKSKGKDESKSKGKDESKSKGKNKDESKSKGKDGSKSKGKGEGKSKVNAKSNTKKKST